MSSPIQQHGPNGVLSVDISGKTYAVPIVPWDATGNATPVIADPYIVVNHTFSLVADMVDQSIFIAPYACQLIAAYEIHKTAESGGTLKIQLTRQQGTEAAASGDALLTNNTNTGFDGVGTAQTLQTATLTATTANLQFAAGNRLGVDFTDDVAGELAGVLITAVFMRL